MVEFGLAFQRSRRPEWVSFYIDYDALKRLLATAPWEFLAKLVQDIETCALHSLEEAGRIAALLRASRAEAGLEALLRLVAFVELNLVAVRKILKKHDKTFEPAAARRAGLRVRYASLNVVDADLASSEAALGHSLGLAAEHPEVFPNVQYAGAFLFAASCYAITPTMHAYATSVGAPRAFGGLLLGASTVAALASTTGCGCVGRRFGFRAPLVAGRLWAARASSSTRWRRASRGRAERARPRAARSSAACSSGWARRSP
ncbi:major facilitator superfamily-like protein [Aureococcus anophagefferens]|nr:major facilitator superfamily-like protein [Aureococcus anophagefferens]